MNHINLKLQGKNRYCLKHTVTENTFFKFFQIPKKKIHLFFTCQIFSEQTETPFPIKFALETLNIPKIDCDYRPSDFDLAANNIKIFQKLFTATNVETLAQKL
ncbi:hypothetical protein CWI36_0382p0010 [Hamiltosporidium magnivora]|uniref:Uncharacterized protein n=1 Tax=Hamiltosporidium magnivora TaxID=148818 RepID=A0A4Q9LHU4_9MICR|nr:hypothetical protein CWI36_0382p0010 [Hamiltosporidium magnivora]